MTLNEFWHWFNQDPNYDFFVDLFLRWNDEWEYEDIKDYTTALNKHYGKQGVKFIDGNDDFHFTLIGSDNKVGELYIDEEKEVLILKTKK